MAEVELSPAHPPLADRPPRLEIAPPLRRTGARVMIWTILFVAALFVSVWRWSITSDVVYLVSAIVLIPVCIHTSVASLYLLTLQNPMFVFAPEGFLLRGAGGQVIVPWEQIATADLKRVMRQMMIAVTLSDLDKVRCEGTGDGRLYARWVRLVARLLTLTSALLLMRPSLLRLWRAGDDVSTMFRCYHRVYGSHYLIQQLYLDRPIKEAFELFRVYCKCYGSPAACMKQ